MLCQPISPHDRMTQLPYVLCQPLAVSPLTILPSGTASLNLIPSSQGQPGFNVCSMPDLLRQLEQVCSTIPTAELP